MISGGRVAELWLPADSEQRKITIRQAHASKIIGQQGTQGLRNDRMAPFSKSINFGNHAKPFPMKPARSFFTTIGFLIYIGALPLRTSPADLPTPQIWVATWGSSQQIPEPQNELPSDDLRDATLRQIFHLSVGGSALRVHLSNAFGTADLHFTSVHIALPLSTSSPSIDPATDKQLTFAGKPDVIVPPGAEFVSDPVKHESRTTLRSCRHVSSRQSARAPDQLTPDPAPQPTTSTATPAAAATLLEPKRVDHWFQISAIDVQAPPGSSCASRAR